MSASSLSDAFVSALRSKIPEDAELTIPPPCFTDMEGEVVDVDPDAGRLVVRFPNQRRFQNPVGFMQGGMIASALDNVFGPLSYLMGWTALTTQLDVRYLTPVAPQVEAIIVEARMTESAGRHLFMQGRVVDVARETTFAVGHAQFRSTDQASGRA